MLRLTQEDGTFVVLLVEECGQLLGLRRRKGESGIASLADSALTPFSHGQPG
jgi:hypothetical protein